MNYAKNCDTLMKIFRESVKPGYRTRADIAEATGLSKVTVGNFVDYLIKLRILNQSYKNVSKIGRRSRYIEAKKIYKSLIISVREKKFEAYIIDLSKTDKTYISFVPDGFFSFENDLRNFVMNSYKMYMSLSKKKERQAGIGVIIEGTYNAKDDIAELSFIKFKLRELFVECGIDEDIHITDGYSCLLRRISLSEQENRSVFILFIDDGISCALFRAGEMSFSLNRCGEFDYFTGKSINKRLNATYDADIQINILLSLIMSVLYTSSPDMIYITGSRYSNISTMGEMLKNKIIIECLSRKINIPDFRILGNNKENSVASEVFERWFINSVLNREISE